MTTPTTNRPLGAKRYAWLLLGFLAAAIYGSLVPLDFTPRPWADALARFRETPYLRLGIHSRSDFAANILLFMPLGFLATGLIGVGRSRFAACAAALIVVPAGFALSSAIEFVQLYFPTRTFSRNDILAESIGGLLGAIIWIACGQRLTDYCSRFWDLTSRRGWLAHMLPSYIVALVIVHLMPIDLVISPVELYHKFREGRVVLLPFTGQYGSLTEFLSKTAWNVAFFVPLGFLYAGQSIGLERRLKSLRQVLFFAALICSAIEFLQLFAWSRWFDSTDILTGIAGTVAGWAVGCWIWLRQSDRLRSQRAMAGRALGLLRALAVLGWLLGLAWVYWYPWTFRDGVSQWRSRLAGVCWFPFTDYYWGTEHHAFDEFHRKFLLTVPLGLLVAGTDSQRAAPRACAPLAFIALVAVAIEVGQLLLPGRFPSVTDSLIYFLGGWCGLLLSRWWRSLKELAMSGCPLPAERA